jgi:orotidine-5'-phosphate decarboxylase
MTLLVPGVGAQGGDVEQTVRAGANADGRGMIINSSRGIIFADDPASAARDLRDAINRARGLST